ncbi:sensor histidine kinase [Granulicoccus sp. GXG6511]|uniref:sensor histidine kinase n=1 Tax=Granulicoccus sp. GXG6511 TaxID=3381351 RepID=UPI003D7D1A87
MLTTRRARILVDVFVGLQVLLTLVSAVIVAAEGMWREVGLGLAGTVVVIVAWVSYRRGRSRVAPPLLLVGAFGTAFTDTGVVSVGFMMLALAIMVLEVGLRAGLWAAGAVVVGLAALTWSVRESWAAVLFQTIGNVVVMTLGLIVGLTLRQIRAEQVENQRLLRELRAAIDTEKELMLADERARSARELHDGLGHRLTLISMSLEYARRVRGRDDAQAWSEVENAQVEAKDALAYMRRWVRALNPPREPNLEGIAALEAIADSFRGTGLTVRVAQNGDEQQLGKDASLFAYRLVQEGLTNVLRHSAADQVAITVNWREGRMEIELRDNGGAVGEGTPESPPPGQAADGGFGLRSLSERARELGGSFEVKRDDDGVVLQGSIPVGSGV